jgi:amino acid adenylation domain-containing protein/thioester reductase-like protein
MSINLNLKYTSKAFAAHKEFWRLNLMANKRKWVFQGNQNISSQKDSMSVLNTEVGHHICDLLNSYSKNVDLENFILLVSGVLVILSRYESQEKVCIHIPKLDDIGLPNEDVKDIPLFSLVDDTKELHGFLTSVNDTILKTYQYQDFPLRELIKEGGDIQYYSNVLVRHTALHSTEYMNYSAFDIVFEFNKRDERTDLLIYYKSFLYSDSLIDGLCKYLLNVLAQFDDLRRKTGELELLTPEERSKILLNFNNSHFPIPEKTAVQIFEDQVRQHSSEPAVIFRNEQLSYGALNELANRLAKYLRDEMGIMPGDTVGVFLEKSNYTIISLLGILKVGAVYVPIDFKTPAKRLEMIVADARLKLMITSSDHLFKLDFAEAKLVAIDIQLAQFPHTPDNLNINISPNEAAYIIYTSGSTGQPKGVLLAHHGLVNIALDHIHKLSITPSDNYLMFMSVSFDASLLDIFMTLLAGATLVIPEDITLQTREYYSSLILDQQITISTFTPSFVQILDETVVQGLRVVICGGEILSPSITNKYFQKTDFYNAYGPAEATVNATLYKVDKHFDGTSVPIGGTSANKQIYIVDKYQRLCPVGVVGELCIAGSGLALKYLNDDELTREKFVDNPFLPGSKMYRTGDMARWREDGNIEYVSRIDDQIKVNGYRVDIGEIENALNTYESIQRSAVALEAQNDSKRLVAFCAFTECPSIGIDVLDQEVLDSLIVHLRKWLPEYMIPHEFYRVAELPLNINSKQDRLKLLELKKKAVRAPKKLASDEAEMKMTGIWEETLETHPIGIHESFFTLGGNSLKAMQLASRIAQAYSVQLQVKDIFEHSTIELLTKFVKTTSSQSSEITHDISIVPLPEASEYEVSPIQSRIWFLSEADPNNSYLVCESFALYGNLDVEAFRNAYHEVIARHEILRTRFNVNKGQLKQTVDSVESSISFSFMKWNDEKHLSPFSLLEEQKAMFIDLRSGPPIKCKLIQVKNDHFILLLTIHHIICDGWSIEILMQEASAFYNAFVAGRKIEIPPLPYQYKEYANWYNKKVKSLSYQSSKQYWMKRFADGFPRVELKADFPRPLHREHRTDNVTLLIDGPLYGCLGKASIQNNTSLFVVVLTVLKILLFRYTGQVDIILGIITAGRRDLLTDKLVGPLINTLALKTTLDGNKTYNETLQQVKQSVEEAMAHQDYQFDQLIADLNIERAPGRSAIFDILINYIQSKNDKSGFDDITIKRLNNSTGGDKFDVTITCYESDSSLAVNINYNKSLFRRERIEAFASHLRNLAWYMGKTNNSKVSNLDFLDEHEKAKLLVDFNATKTSYPSTSNLSDLFKKQVEETPDQIALRFFDQTITYRKLHARTTMLANVLIRKHGVKPGDFIALYLDRSPEMVISIIAIVQVGATYIPLDYSNPIKRCERIIKDCGIRVIITNESNKGNFEKEDRKVLAIETLSSESRQFGGTNVKISTSPDSLAYVMSTSGSTGIPKNVMITHKSIIRLVKNTNYYNFKTGERMLQTVPYSFDVSTFEIWGMLLNGGELHILPSEQLLDTNFLRNYLHIWSIDIIWFTAGWFSQLAEKDISIFAKLKTLLLGGDKLSFVHVNKVVQAYPTVNILNCYGPTENTTFSTTFKIDRIFTTEIPIGKPIANSTLYVLDTHGQLVPIGIPGELYVGGDGISLGYIGNPTATKERFVSINLDGTGEVALYKTGDLGYWNYDGNVEFIGRDDFQVKIGGYRIEINEIETALLKHPSIELALVMPYMYKNEEKRLVAYYTAPTEIPRKELRTFLVSFLPEYMIPTYFMHLTKVQVNANGKIDRAKLPSPKIQKQGPAQSEVAVGDQEQLVIESIKRVLGDVPVDPTDNFFTIGGNSFLALQLVTELSKSFNVSINDVFQYQTVANLAAHLKYDKHGLQKRLTLLMDKARTFADSPGIKSAVDEKHTCSKALAEWQLTTRPATIETILLLGATGYLGAHLLQLLLTKFPCKVVTIVRGDSVNAAKHRLNETLNFYFRESALVWKDKVTVLTGDITHDDLGLEKDMYESLLERIDCVVNCAADTRHFGGYERFEAVNYKGVRHLADFVRRSRGAELHHVSTLSVRAGIASSSGPEYFSETDLNIGQKPHNHYVQTKLMAELFLDGERRNGLPCNIYRVGNLVFNSQTGIFQRNIQDNAFYSVIKSFIEFGYFPKSDIYHDYSFVDQAAEAIMRIIKSDKINGNFHVYNPNYVTLGDVSENVRKAGYEVQLVQPEVVIGKVLERIDNLDKNISTLIQRFSYVMDTAETGDVKVDASRTQAFLQKLEFSWDRLTQDHVKKMLAHCENVGFITR